MKKFLFFLVLFLIFPLSISANSKKRVDLYKCVDGDTAWFILDNSKIKARFLAIDTPESTKEKEHYGKEASDFTCNLLKNASKIEIEYDEKSNKLDKYDRHLVWVFTDDILLQDEIIKNGFADIKYIYGDYKYLNKLNKSLKEAKKNKLNIWSNSDNSLDYIFAILSIMGILLLFIFNKKERKKFIKSITKKVLD